jgi:hypothetical protein
VRRSARSPLSPHFASPEELKQRIETERRGNAFLVFRDGEAGQRIVTLHNDRPTAIGRDDECDACIAWDERVSRLHAEITRVGSHWLVGDDGLSRNGTCVNGERVAGRRRLGDGDQVAVGDTVLVFREPNRRAHRSTAAASDVGATPEPSPAQQKVLVALCRPFRDGDQFATPATNQQIADELCLTVAAVKTHLRLLFQRFGLVELPHNKKRATLARRAIELGLVGGSDFDPMP